MINIEEATITHINIQSIVQDVEISDLNSSLKIAVNEENDATLIRLLLKPFTNHSETFEFDHSVALEYNVLFSIAKAVYEEENFVEQSKQIFQHLTAVSTNTNIKDGELFVAKFDDIRLGNKYLQGLGIYKFEEKENFVETTKGIEGIQASFRKGFGSKKPEKGCLILFDEEPFTILVIDSNVRETDYWRNDFIQHRSKQDNVNSTNNFLKMTKSYITDQMPSEFEVEKTDQIELLNKSLDYFKKNESFSQSEFENSVLGDEEAIKSFQSFGNSYQESHHLEISDEFDIAPQSVKKQARIFKSILKLDKNFHVYIHGDRNKIEKGADENGKYYKIYFENEA